jgi:hypothetical protein
MLPASIDQKRLGFFSGSTIRSMPIPPQPAFSAVYDYGCIEMPDTIRLRFFTMQAANTATDH